MTRILMIASYGLEIVECGGALARAVDAGDDVHAAVLLAREASRPQIAEAAERLGIAHEVEFLAFEAGSVDLDVPSRVRLVELVRRVRPDIVIFQDPEHSAEDLDPDRRLIALLVPEALALASRDWRIEECGGRDPQPVPTIYHMTPLRPNCLVEIGPVIARKHHALEALGLQLAFTAEAIRRDASPEALRHLVPNVDELAGDDRALGLELHRRIDTGLAVTHGVGDHWGAILAEAYRRVGPFVVERLAV